MTDPAPPTGSDYTRSSADLRAYLRTAVLSRAEWVGVVVALAIGVGLIVSDPWLARLAGWFPEGGDVRRELEALQQYGGMGSLLIVGFAVWLLDPGRRRRLLDLAAAAAVTGAVVQVLKMLVGRPRPRFGEPDVFLGPLGSYPLDAERGVRHAWEFWVGIQSDLWSMPSSHTSAAMALSVFLAVLYPRVRALAWTLVALVGVTRVLTGAHYASDVVVGGAAAYPVAMLAVRRMWGVRLLDWVWVRCVDRGAEPAAPGMVERRGGGSGAGGAGADAGRDRG